MRGALEVHQALLQAGVPHEVVRLDSRITAADELPRALGLPTGCLAVRCYVVSRDGEPAAVAAVLVPAGRTPAPGPLLEALGARSLRPALAAEVNAATDCAAGLVCPVGLPAGVALLADAAVGATDVVYAPIGESGLALGIRTRDLLVATGARVATLTTSPLPVEDAVLGLPLELRLGAPADPVRLGPAPLQRRPA